MSTAPTASGHGYKILLSRRVHSNPQYAHYHTFTSNTKYSNKDEL